MWSRGQSAGLVNTKSGIGSLTKVIGDVRKSIHSYLLLCHNSRKVLSSLKRPYSSDFSQRWRL